MGKLHIVLLLYALMLTMGLVLAGKKVNLIFPKIQGARMDNCTFSGIFYESCNFTVWTRAGEYRLINFDLEKGQRGHIERSGNWKSPLNILQQDLYKGDKQISYLLLASRAKIWHEKFYKNGLAVIEQPLDWWIYDACTIYKGVKDEYEICFMNGASYITMKSNHTFSAVHPMATYFEIGYLEHAAPITAAVAISRGTRGAAPSNTSNIENMDLVLFDATGRMIINRYSITDFSKPLKPLSTSIVDLSSIENPSAFDLATGWQKSSDFINSSMKSKFKERLLDKMSSSYIEAITPIFPGIVNTKSPVRNKRQIGRGPTILFEEVGDIKNATIAPPTKPTTVVPVVVQEETIALCLSRGYKMFDDKVKRRNVVCSHKGIDQSSFVDMPFTQNTMSAYIIHAYHIGNFNGTRYVHLFYSIRHPTEMIDKMLYIYCPRKGELTGQAQNVSNDLQLDGKINQGDCSPRDGFIDPPNDIIGFNDGKCDVVIVFYDFIYAITNITVPLVKEKKTMQYLDGINFKINAAFSVKNKIYFFTHSNHLLIVEASLDSSCTYLTLNMDSMKQMFSEEFIYKNAFQKASDEPLRAPYMIDYREYEEEAGDTYPPVAFRSQDLPPPIPPVKPISPTPKPGTKKEGSNMVILSIGLVVGGLIIAAIIYLFCLRGKTDDDHEPARVRKSRKSPYMDPDLMVKTVRSKHTMSSPPPPLKGSSKILKSHKSMKSQKPNLASTTSGTTQTDIKSSKSKVSLHKSKATSPKAPSHKSKIVSPTSPGKSKATSPSTPVKSNKSIKSPKSPRSPKSVKSHKSKRTPTKKN